MPPKDGFHLTWSKAAVVVAALGVLQGAGFLMNRPRSSTLDVRLAVLEEKVDGLAKQLDVIESCLLENRCGKH